MSVLLCVVLLNCFVLAHAAPPAGCEANCMHRSPVRLSWAKLLKRV